MNEEQQMKTYSFEVDFGYGSKPSYSAVFNLELDEKEIAYIKDYLKENGDCGYEYMESENPRLFDKINDAANNAVVEAINRNCKKKIDFFDIDWSGMSFDFIWPDELLPNESI